MKFSDAVFSGIRLVLLFAAFGSTLSSQIAMGEVPFERTTIANNTDSRFTNVADINGDDRADVLAFKGGKQGLSVGMSVPTGGTISSSVAISTPGVRWQATWIVMEIWISL